MAYGDKKHYTQMDQLESDFLMRKFFEIDQQEWSFTSYCVTRFNERKIDAEHFLSLFNSDVQLIEYHMKHNSNRILLRSKAIHEGYQVCAVFNLTDKRIVTVYTNKITNQHNRLKKEFYNPNLDVFSKYNEVKRK